MYSSCFDPATKPYVPQRLIRKACQWARDKWQRRPPPCSVLLAQASSNSQQYSIGATNHLLHDQWTFPHHSVIMIELANIQSVIDLWGVGVLASSPTFEVQDSSLSAWCSISLVQKSQWQTALVKTLVKRQRVQYIWNNTAWYDCEPSENMILSKPQQEARDHISNNII